MRASATRKPVNIQGEPAHYESSPRWPHLTRLSIFTDGCAKQYKGKRDFRLVALSPCKLGVVTEHNFAATSHFKESHEGIGGVAKNMMYKAELSGNDRIADSATAYEFLKNMFED